jgi:glucuronokinase
MAEARAYAHARAALVGNPSDGYHGATLATVIRDFRAEATVRDAPADDLPDIDLVEATVRRFRSFAAMRGLGEHDRPVAITVSSTIPERVGLAGSSAIVVAVLRALSELMEVQIPHQELPSLALAVEVEELGIMAGLQDRVAQVYDTLVLMDFAPDERRPIGQGFYEPMDPALLPPLYVAWRPNAAEPSQIVHEDLRARFDRGELKVHIAMAELRELALAARGALLDGDVARLGGLIDRSADIRASVLDLKPEHWRMVELARACGASANYTGSGGAIVGTHTGPDMMAKIRDALEGDGCEVMEPAVAPPAEPAPAA